MARKKKSEFVSAVGVVFEIIKKISDAVRTLGGNDDDLHRVLTEGGLAQKIAEVIMVSKQNVQETYNVVVDYSKTLAEMINAGNYDWHNDDINDQHFPLQDAGQHEAELVLVHLNMDATTKQVLEHLKSQGFEPAKIEHLLAFGAKYPEIQREFPLIALGSVWVDGSGHRNDPYLYCDDGKRELRLDWNDDADHWYVTCHFLAFRK